MLSDNFIHGFNILCRRQIEHVAGFQDPFLGQTFQCSLIKNQKFGQTLHSNGVHWVAISTNNFKNGEVNYYDSLFSSRINYFDKATNMRIDAGRWGCTKNKCHARSTANKFSELWNICDGIFNLHFVGWRSKDSAPWWKLVRESLLQMLVEQHIKRFPATENNVVKCKFKSISMESYCSCRPSWFKNDATVENKQMAECGSCRK